MCSRIVATLLVMLFALSTVHAQEAAKPASSFLDSIGIGAGLSFNPPFPCANYTKEKTALTTLGVRHIRSGETGPVAIAAYQDLSKSGIKTMLCIDANYGVRPDSSFWINAPGSDSAGWGDPSPGYNVHDFVKQVGPGAVIDSVEMANEIDCSYSQNSQYWHTVDYPKSHISADPTSPLYWVNYIVAATKASYTAIKSDPATAMVSVVGNALGGTYRAPPNPNPQTPGSLYSYTDYGCFHPYPGWSDPAYSSATLLNYYAANYRTPFTQFDSSGNLINARSMVASETGYATGTGSGATSEVVQGKYIPRLFCEAYCAGIARTFVYCLFDSGSSTYGLLHPDFTPKPAYTALKNLLGVLSDNSTGFSPGSLIYTLTVLPVNNYKDTLTGITANYGIGNVHHLLLQKSDGTFDLLLWNEIPDQTGSASGTITEQEPPALPASISLPGNVSGANLYTLNDDGSMQCTNEQVVNGVINFTIRDTVEVLHVGVPATVQINCGSSQTGTFHGDMDFTGGSVGAYANPVSTTGVTNPAPALAYQTERFGNFTYTIPNLTPGGSYTLRLHFAEIYWNQANARLFNVIANGTTLLSNFDVFATAGGKNRAIVESFPVTADSSGKVVVQFVTVKNNAKVSAMELVPAP